MYSFVIPARNEEESVGRLIRSIHEFAPGDAPHEVILVDNGSTDGTAAEALGAGARVVTSSARTIGAARNAGVAIANGDTVVFLDADCLLTPEWREHIGAVMPQVRGSAFVCAGAQVYPPRSPRHLLWEHWFRPFALQEGASHIGSAHFICRRQDFLAVGGFDESLATGEDYDLCARIRARGGRLINEPRLVVEHHGFPSTLSEFVRRERWHGRGDAVSVASVLRSRVAMASLLFVGLSGLGIVLWVSGRPAAALVAALGAVALLLASAAWKFRHAGVRTMLVATVLFVPYYVGRTLSVLDGLMAGPRKTPSVPRE